MGIFTDRVRSTREGYVLTRVCPSVCPHLRGVPWPGPAGGVSGGYPTLGTTPSDLAGGVPRWGVPQVPPPPARPGRGGYPISISTWYAAVSMPLAFTQEDFLVGYLLWPRSVRFPVKRWKKHGLRSRSLKEHNMKFSINCDHFSFLLVVYFFSNMFKCNQSHHLLNWTTRRDLAILRQKDQDLVLILDKDYVN